MKDVRVLLLYPPDQSSPGTMCKPNGSLAYPSLAGSLRRAGVDVKIYDACVGDSNDDLDDAFYRSASDLPTGLLRTGVSDDRILQVASDYDIIGLTSIFTEQETMVLTAARLIREVFPEKILIAGGVNARSRLTKFFGAGFDAICMSEAEGTILEIVDAVRSAAGTRGCPDLSSIGALAYRDGGEYRINRIAPDGVLMNLDQLPLPAWDLLPNDRYWKIARPHGGFFPQGAEVRYASMMTSLGCPFHCAYCHIAGEQEGSDFGFIGKYRIKSDERVLQELDILKGLGVKQLFIEDDSLFGMKKRSLRLLGKIRGLGFDILDVNGINVVHLLKRWKPDHDVLRALADAGFTEIVLPFESGNLRILRKYASNKLNIEMSDIKALIEACKEEYGFRITGNYMLGYPDETLEEIQTTTEMARRHVGWGLDAANFFLVMPLPGTPLFDMAVANGNLSADFNPDAMNWTKANMRNTLVPPAQLEEIRDHAWETVNPASYRDYKKSMVAGIKQR